MHASADRQGVVKFVICTVTWQGQTRTRQTSSSDRIYPNFLSSAALNAMFSNNPHRCSLDYASMLPTPLPPRNPSACPRFTPQVSTYTAANHRVTRSKQGDNLHPMLRRRHGEQNSRRQAFLTKVKQNRDHRRWDLRADQVPYIDLV